MSLPFSVQFLPVENLSALAEDKNVLAAIRFASIASAENTSKPLFSVGLPNLALSNVVEVWYSDMPIQTTTVGALQLAWNDDVLFGHLLLDEAPYQTLTEITKEAYELIFSTLETLAYSNILRIWNYLPSNDQNAQGVQPYQAFCEGRHESLKATHHWHYVPPASTTIGTACSGLQIYFIAAKESGKQLQNPRQASDVLYPRLYGPVRPTFSHAVIKQWQDTTHLYISGTLSIVDYKKRHNGKVLLQLDEVLDTIETLIIHGAEQRGFFLNSLTDLSHLKVYLCDLFMLSITEELLIRRYGSQLPPVLFLRGDICETDLLIEVEAVYIQSGT
jgi:chorismate lyase/3-hydroxybenzoate synthase